MQGMEGFPTMDEDQVEDMWVDFSRRIRAGEVQGGAGQVIVTPTSSHADGVS